MEIALPWAPHTDASYVRRTEAPDRDADYELQRAELDDAETRPIFTTKQKYTLSW